MSIDVFEVIKSRHKKNKALQEQRIKEVESLNPLYSDLIDHRNALLSEAAIMRLSHKEKEAKQNEKEAEKLELVQKKILKDLNLPEDYLDDIYDCPICQDRGYLDNDEPCNCMKKIIRQNKYQAFDLTENFKDSTFENFNLKLFSKKRESKDTPSPFEAITHYLELALSFCRNFPEKKPSFFIYGKVGVGKTYFVSCIVNELIKKDIDIIYISAPNLLNYLYEDIKNYSGLEDSYKNEFKNIELLVIDDLGSENMNDFSLAALSEIIDSRILNDKSTIITSNYSPNLIMANQIYPERMTDRILHFYNQLPFIGNNLRKVASFNNL